MAEVKVVAVLPAFAGSATKVVPWLAQYKAQVDGSLAADATEEQKKAAYLAKFAQNCSAKSYEVLTACGALDGDFAALEAVVKELYLSGGAAADSLAALQRRRQGHAETVMEFYEACIVLAKDAEVDFKQWKGHFIQALKPSIYEKIAMLDAKDLKAVLTLAMKAERIQQTQRPEEPAPSSVPLTALAVGELEQLVAAVIQRERGREHGRKQGRKQGRERGSRPGRREQFAGKCWACGEVGHKEDQCRDTNGVVSGGASHAYYRQPSKCEVHVVQQTCAFGPVLDMQLHGRAVQAMVDSGSARSLLSADAAKRCGVSGQTRSGVKLITASGAPLPDEGTYEGVLLSRGHRFATKLVVVPGLAVELLLGRDFIAKHRLVLDIAGGRVQLRSLDSKRVNLQYRAPEKSVSLAVGEGGMPDGETRTWETMRNEFKACFSSRPDQYALARCAPMRVRLRGDPVPVQRRPRRTSVPLRMAMRRQCKTWLQEGIISPSKSEWAFNAMMVEKDDKGELRTVIDFAPLGPLTEDDPFPAPFSQSILDQMDGNTVFSVMDLKHAYLQVPLDPASRHILSFVTEDGHYQFNRVPFGFKNSGAALQRALAKILEGIPNVHGYADDWLIAAKTWEEHWTAMRQFLAAIEKAGFLLKTEKCQVGREEVQYLGRRISAQGVSVLDDGVDKAMSIREPTTTTELRCFLGAFQWYSQFIPDFARICVPLNPLRSDKARWDWGKPQREAFESLREALTSAPVLRHPDFAKEFTVETDASGTALGAVLLQEGHPVAYAGRALKPAERQLGITALELSAVVFALEHWHVYLHGPRRFRLYTDHKSLQWIQSSKNLSGKLAQWALVIQGYNIEVVHRPGSKQGMSDTLSRLTEVLACSEEELTTETLLEAQGRDPECMRLARILGEAPTGDQRQAVRQFIIMPDGVLSLIVEKYQRQTFRPVIPSSLRAAAIKTLHDQQGHLGRDATLKKAMLTFYWPAMAEDVAKYVEGCLQCQQRKPPAGRQILEGTVTSEAFNDLVALDVLAGFQVSPSGHGYVLVICDYFTRFVIAVPMRSKSAADVAAAYQAGWVGTFGHPRRLLSDQGSEFSSSLFLGCLRGTVKVWTTPYHPQTDGLVERFNRTLLAMLATSCEGRETEWTLHIGDCVGGYNATPNTVTGVSPYLAVFARDPPSHWSAVEERQVEERKADVAATDEEIAAKHKKREEIVKARNARLTKPVGFKVGQLVLVRDLAVHSQAYRKLASEWQGPFRVLAKPTMYTVLVIPRAGGNAKTVNLRNVKSFKPPWNSSTSPSRATAEQQRIAVTRKIMPEERYFHVVAESGGMAHQLMPPHVPQPEVIIGDQAAAPAPVVAIPVQVQAPPIVRSSGRTQRVEGQYSKA
jgi:hypothetical protein